jgi:hypothetical protein
VAWGIRVPWPGSGLDWIGGVRGRVEWEEVGGSRLGWKAEVSHGILVQKLAGPAVRGRKRTPTSGRDKGGRAARQPYCTV